MEHKWSRGPNSQCVYCGIFFDDTYERKCFAKVRRNIKLEGPIMAARYQLYKFVNGEKIPDGHEYHTLIDCLIHAHDVLKGKVDTDILDSFVPVVDYNGVYWVVEKFYEIN